MWCGAADSEMILPQDCVKGQEFALQCNGNSRVHQQRYQVSEMLNTNVIDTMQM